jgi:hypothetical protein
MADLEGDTPAMHVARRMHGHQGKLAVRSQANRRTRFRSSQDRINARLLDEPSVMDESCFLADFFKTDESTLRYSSRQLEAAQVQQMVRAFTDCGLRSLLMATFGYRHSALQQTRAIIATVRVLDGVVFR